MKINKIISQLRTTDLTASIDFYTKKLGCTLDFEYENFYAGLNLNGQAFHLKYVCDKDPSIDDVDEGGHFHLYFQTDDAAKASEFLKNNGVRFEKELHETDWQTKEFVIKDDQGHTLYFGQPL
jgi:catechol 2,3-dioxygenase-like lactoylglutathione lyase family enzyme